MFLRGGGNKRFLTAMAVGNHLLLLFCVSAFIFCLGSASQEQRFYTFSALGSNGLMKSFEHYRGKVTLVTNVASYCGYTNDHYREFVSLQDTYGDWLNILAFPCNQFGEQEPEDVQTITREMRRKFNVNFEIFEKINVIGDDVPEFWQYLNEQSETTPQWNFFKYLINHHGQVMGAWGPRVGVDHIKPFIEDAVREAKRYHDREEL